MEEILDIRRIRGGVVQYKVQWVGYPPDPTWYPSHNFDNAPDILNDFHTRYLAKPRPSNTPSNTTPNTL